jgi:hypothetical protein
MTVESLQKYKEGLTAGLNRNLGEFEKNFFLVAAGTFAFSITFIKDLVKIQGCTYIFFLFFAWGLIALSVGLIMYSYLASANKSSEIWSAVDEFLTTNMLFDVSKELTDDQSVSIRNKISGILTPGKKHLRIVRFFSGGLFITGILSFSFFVGVNLLREKDKPVNEPKPSFHEIRLNTSSDSFYIKYSDSSFLLNKTTQ